MTAGIGFPFLPGLLPNGELPAWKPELDHNIMVVPEPEEFTLDGGGNLLKFSVTPVGRFRRYFSYAIRYTGSAINDGQIAVHFTDADALPGLELEVMARGVTFGGSASPLHLQFPAMENASFRTVQTFVDVPQGMAMVAQGTGGGNLAQVFLTQSFKEWRTQFRPEQIGAIPSA